jgi:hypothetical protein
VERLPRPSYENLNRFLVATKNYYGNAPLKARDSTLKLFQGPKAALRGTMGNRSRMSHTATVVYVGEMATELARMAGEIQCAKLAYILEVAALEARTALQPAVDFQSGASALH